MASKGRIVDDVVGALRNEEAAKLAAQRDAQAARTRMHELEACFHHSENPCPNLQLALNCTESQEFTDELINSVSTSIKQVAIVSVLS